MSAGRVVLRLGATVHDERAHGFIGKGSLLDYLATRLGPGPYTPADAVRAIQAQLGGRAVAGSVRCPGLTEFEPWPHVIGYSYTRSPGFLAPGEGQT